MFSIIYIGLVCIIKKTKHVISIIFALSPVFFPRLKLNLQSYFSVAFHVRLLAIVNNLASNGRVVFGIVYLNEGKGYDSSTGIFTAPAAGLYVFNWTTLTQQGKLALTSLTVNGTFKSLIYCNDSKTNTYMSCSKSTVEKLKKGDQVWIGVFLGPAYMHNQYTSFSGYKL